jgi:hypothetical protein
LVYAQNGIRLDPSWVHNGISVFVSKFCIGAPPHFSLASRVSGAFSAKPRKALNVRYHPR